MKILVLVVSLMTMVSVQADSSVGCGLGQIVFKKNSIVSALLRATTNGTFSSQLFGITSGTSGCARHSIVKKDMVPQYFAESNFEQLQIDIAKGEGQYIKAFAYSFECSNNVHLAFNNKLQANYGALFSGVNSSSQSVVNNVKNMITNDKLLKANCPNII